MISPTTTWGAAVRPVNVVLVVIVVALAAACGRAAPPIGLATGCDGAGRPCVRYLPGIDSDGAPLDRSSLLLTLTAPASLGPKPANLAAVTAAIDLETGAPALKLVPVRALRADPQDRRQVYIDLAGMLAGGAAIDLPEAVIRSESGKPQPGFTVKVESPVTPLAVSLAGVMWTPSDTSLFRFEGTVKPGGSRDEAKVRVELEGRLRIRPGSSDADGRVTYGKIGGANTRGGSGGFSGGKYGGNSLRVTTSLKLFSRDTCAAANAIRTIALLPYCARNCSSVAWAGPGMSPGVVLVGTGFTA